MTEPVPPEPWNAQTQVLHADAGIAWHAGVLPPIHSSATFKADDVADFADGLRRRHRVRKCAAASRPRAVVSSLQLPTHAVSLGGV